MGTGLLERPETASRDEGPDRLPAGTHAPTEAQVRWAVRLLDPDWPEPEYWILYTADPAAPWTSGPAKARRYLTEAEAHGVAVGLALAGMPEWAISSAKLAVQPLDGE